MARYQVIVEFRAEQVVDVEADSPAQAREQALASVCDLPAEQWAEQEIATISCQEMQG